MSRSAEIRLDFAGTQRRFRLAIGQLEALQEACNAGPLEIYHRLVEGRWRVQDLRETLYLGLVGGGGSDKEATRLVRQVVDQFGLPPIALVPLAKAVLLAALFGVPDETLETPPATTEEEDQPGGAPSGGAGAAETGASASPPSTEQAPS